MSSFGKLQARIAARLTVQACGAIVLSVSSASLIGYALDWVGLYQWHQGVAAMSPNSATAFLATGIGILTIGVSDRVWKCL